MLTTFLQCDFKCTYPKQCPPLYSLPPPPAGLWLRVNSTDQKNPLCGSHPNPPPPTLAYNSQNYIAPLNILTYNSQNYIAPLNSSPQWPMTPRITVLLDLLLFEWTALIRVNNTDNVTKTLPSKCWQHSFHVILNVHTPNSAPPPFPPHAGLWLPELHYC